MDCTVFVTKTKAQLICAFDFAYANSRFFKMRLRFQDGCAYIFPECSVRAEDYLKVDRRNIRGHNIAALNNKTVTECKSECDKFGMFCGSFEPRSEKTGLRGFRPGPTQTGLCSH